MIIGIGTDILKIQRIRDIQAGSNDPFFKKIFSEKEKEQASLRPDPILYYATRFAGKEAVFKSIGIDANDVRLNEIEILGMETGQPQVTLYGNLKEIAAKKGITNFLISLSYENDYSVAFVIAQD